MRDNGADSVLIGRITQEHKHLLVETTNGDQREMETNLVVNIRWVDRRGDVIREGRPIKIPADAIDVNAAAHYVSEYGQSTATAQLQAIQRVAEEVVNLMESAVVGEPEA